MASLGALLLLVSLAVFLIGFFAWKDPLRENRAFQKGYFTDVYARQITFIGIGGLLLGALVVALAA